MDAISTEGKGYTPTIQPDSEYTYTHYYIHPKSLKYVQTSAPFLYS